MRRQITPPKTHIPRQHNHYSARELPEDTSGREAFLASSTALRGEHATFADKASIALAALSMAVMMSSPGTFPETTEQPAPAVHESEQ